ncbi:hypothetical protein Mp_Vg00660 [Marchantia polymorpha subsp. ruderalis]|uniref:Uncharacterized protein n=1 Tax=Marchantia polymorpha TaxID=3197 RepID=A0A2R6VX75_MARPO|nr:hypothetical protein MARPO_YA0050 [Marchantia polymorpha]BBN20562.1 hypothetical protein Mp_Vg00660 [Marchantia polymorpha subsp. ruderalis]|eukprot:PTQ26200.1 hypothetical protein MARPO_YA0050 [Marchantia polymorpha]
MAEYIYRAGFVKGLLKTPFQVLGGTTNIIRADFDMGTGLVAENIGTFILVYRLYSTTDAKRKARKLHVTMLASLPIEFAVFGQSFWSLIILIIGCGINQHGALAAALWNHQQAKD